MYTFFKNDFGLPDRYKKALFGLGFKLTLKRNSGKAVLSRNVDALNGKTDKEEEKDI